MKNFSEINRALAAKKKHFLTFVLALVALSASANSQPQGAISGLFKINDAGDKVWISQGNLQYQASTGTFRFAPNQYDIIGAANSNIAANYSGWIDLFGYGTSGYNNVYPYKSDAAFDGYGNGTEDIAGTNYDWGVYNKISNGGNKAGIWRTPTQEEWYYIMTQHYKYYATINGQTGIILLPTDFVFTTEMVDLHYVEGKYTENVLNTSQWSVLDAAGAIFLPAAGNRFGKDDIDAVGTEGYYWSSITKSESSSYAMAAEFEEGKTIINGYSQLMCAGSSVRLVADRVVEDYHLSINGVALNELNIAELSIDGSISFNPSTRVLTLTDAYLLASPSVSNLIDATEAITVNLVGLNHIVSTNGAAFNLAAGSTIKGSGELVVEAAEGVSRTALSFADGLGIAGNKEVRATKAYITRITNNQTLSTAFSVSPNCTVQFVRSNLQYNEQLDLYRFAPSAIETEDETTDPILGKWDGSMIWAENQWGDAVLYNAGNQSGQWRLLQTTEWQYLLFQRENALYKFSYGSVAGRYGLILLPDNWTLPSGLDFVVYPLLPTTPSDAQNSYSEADWAKMENAGAVFLPYYGNTAACTYWLPEEADADNAYHLFAKWGQNPNVTEAYRKNNWNNYVRLVKGAYSQGIDNVDSGKSKDESQKILRDGVLYILRGEKVYTVTGEEVK